MIISRGKIILRLSFNDLRQGGIFHGQGQTEFFRAWLFGAQESVFVRGNRFANRGGAGTFVAYADSPRHGRTFAARLIARNDFDGKRTFSDLRRKLFSAIQG